LTDDALAGLQTSTSDWHARRARVLLQHRGSSRSLSPGSVAQLRSLFQESKNGDYRLRALWTLYITGNFKEEDLQKALTDKDEYVRAWPYSFSVKIITLPKKRRTLW